VRDPDQIGAAGKVWHLKRCPKQDKMGNIAVSTAVVPGGNPKGAWLIVILREYRKKRKFMPTLRTHENSKLEFIIGVLSVQPLDMDLSLKSYPRLNPIVVLVQFPDIKGDIALQLFDSALTMLINGYLLPNSIYLTEWRVFLVMMVDQILGEANNKTEDPERSFLQLKPVQLYESD